VDFLGMIVSGQWAVDSGQWAVASENSGFRSQDYELPTDH